jgi:spore coat protein A
MRKIFWPGLTFFIALALVVGGLGTANAQPATVVDPLYTAPILDPAAIPQFMNSLPLAARQPASGVITMTMGAGTQNLIGGGLGLMTDIWGYGYNGNAPTYPGPTLVVQTNFPTATPLTVNWGNNLAFNSHLLKQGIPANGDVVDRTLHWALGVISPNIYFNDVGGITAVPHLHGGFTESVSDGLPEAWWTPGLGAVGGHFFTTQYIYSNNQEGGTLWYHDHALGITRLNVYAGMAGFYFLRDANENLLISTNTIPIGPQEIELVFQDRMFYPDGRLAYPDATWVSPVGFEAFPGGPSHQPEFFGQVILVNGNAWPFLNVEPRQYRFRMLNGSDSRFYEFALPFGLKFMVIGNDDGFLNNPVSVNKLVIGPGERYDVVIDFSKQAGKTAVMTNSARSPFPKGATVTPQLDGRIISFNVGLNTTGNDAIAPVTAATNLRPVLGALPAVNTTGATVRQLLLFEGLDRYGRLQPLLGTVGPTGNTATEGTWLWDDPVTETPNAGATEVWEVYNTTADAHPIHLHLVAFRIVDRQGFNGTILPKTNVDPMGNTTQGGILTNVKLTGQPKGPAAYEAGPKDTAIMYPGEVTRVVATFNLPAGYRFGQTRYVWHCHILSHEDHEMMRPYEVQP